MKTLLLFTLCFLNFSHEIQARVFTIKKGSHDIEGVHANFQKKSISKIKVRFLEGTDYILNRDDQGDWNKLWGFSDCNSLHHTNSARFVWRWNPLFSQIELGAYTYVNGKRFSESMGFLSQHEELTLTLRADGYDYLFSLSNGHQIKMKRGCNGDGGIKMVLSPYFGGNNPAPNDMKIDIDDMSKNGYITGEFTVALPYPNPIILGRSFRIPVEAGYKDERIYFEVFDVIGRKTSRVPKFGFFKINANETVDVDISSNDLGATSAGMYLLIAMNDQEEVGLSYKGEFSTKVIMLK